MLKFNSGIISRKLPVHAFLSCVCHFSSSLFKSSRLSILRFPICFFWPVPPVMVSIAVQWYNTVPCRATLNLRNKKYLYDLWSQGTFCIMRKRQNKLLQSTLWINHLLLIFNTIIVWSWWWFGIGICRICPRSVSVMLTVIGTIILNYAIS